MSYYDPSMQNEAIIRKNDERRKNIRTIVIAVVIVIILVIVVIILYFVLKARSTKTTSTSTTTPSSTTCSSNSNCPSSSPVCQSGLCVQCANDSNCSGNLKKCQLSTNTCIQCTASADCPTNAVCKTGSTVCVACNVDADCICGTCSGNACVPRNTTPTITTFESAAGNMGFFVQWTPITGVGIGSMTYDVKIIGPSTTYTTTGLTGSFGYIPVAAGICFGDSVTAQIRSESTPCGVSAYSSTVSTTVTGPAGC